MGFFYLYIICFVILAIGLGALGLDFITALSGAATSISNVGPGLGNLIGAEGNFATLPDMAKWIMAFGMLLGRLELFTVLVMLNPGFWRPLGQYTGYRAASIRAAARQGRTILSSLASSARAWLSRPAIAACRHSFTARCTSLALEDSGIVTECEDDSLIIACAPPTG